MERGAARRRARRHRHGVPAGHRPRRDVRRAVPAPRGDRDLRRGARQAPRLRAPGQARALPGADVLLAQREPVPRPALGARAGDLRRGPVPDRAPRRGVHRGDAGNAVGGAAAEVPEAGGDREALRGAQRTRDRAPPLRCARERARSARQLPAAVRGLRARGARRRGHAGLQPRRRRAVRRQPAAAGYDPARTTGALAASSSPTAAPSTTSTASTGSRRRRKRRRRWRYARART